MSTTTAPPGTLITQGDPGWDTARQAFNLAVDQHPAALARPSTAEETREAVRYASGRGLRVAAQSTGHNAGPLGPLADTLLIRTDAMRSVTVDPASRTARVGAGARWQDVQTALDGCGLVGLAGSSPTVGVAGYALGGGIGWTGRRHGLCANTLTALDVVTADGDVRRADPTQETDLFWALRGGGGSFGVVTALELRLFPLAEVAAGLLWWPLDAAAEVLHTWRELTAGLLPDALTTTVRLLRLPADPALPERVRGGSFVVVDAVHLGTESEARRLLASLLRLRPAIDTLALVPARVLSRLHMDPAHPTSMLVESATLDELPTEVVDDLVRLAGPDAEDALPVVEVRQLGGELRRARPDSGALAAIDAGFLVLAAGPAPDRAARAATRRRARAVRTVLDPWAATQSYLNATERPREPADFWKTEAYDRLRRVKAAVDPEDRIHANHPVPPWPAS